VIDKVAREVAAIFADPVLEAHLSGAGLSAESSTPEQLDALIRSDSTRWKALIDTGIADKILN
jgi:tripartite-type tricarboxylate transporter receptor subunit TctC